MLNKYNYSSLHNKQHTLEHIRQMFSTLLSLQYPADCQQCLISIANSRSHYNISFS